MGVYMSMLYYQLEKKHNISYNQKKFLDKLPLKLPLYFTGYSLSSDYVYLTTAEELNHMETELSNLNILCLGTPSCRPLITKCEMIMIESSDPCYDIHALHNEVSMIFQIYHEWEDSLIKLTYGSQDLLEMFRISEKILENPCVLIDSNFTYMVYTTNFVSLLSIFNKEDRSSIPLNYVNEFRMDEDFKRLTRKKGLFTYSGHKELGNMLCHNLTYRNRYFARLLMPDTHHPICEADKKHLAIVAHQIQTIFDARTKSVASSNRIGNVHQLLQTLAIENKPASITDIDRVLNDSDWNRTDHYLAIYLKLLISSRVSKNISYLCSKIENLWKGSCTLSDGEDKILWILNLNLYQNSRDYFFEDTFAVFLRETLCQAGISNDYSDISQTPLFVQQAKIALQIGGQKNPTHWYHYFRDYTLAYLYSQCTAQFPVSELCHPAILKLYQHDKDKNTAYYKTLKTYIENKFKASDTADSLVIHRTTLVQRLKKIQELFSLDLNDPQTIQHLMLSFSLFQEMEL